MGGRSDTMGPFVEASGYEGGVWEEEEGQSQINLLIKTSCSKSIQGFRTPEISQQSCEGWQVL